MSWRLTIALVCSLVLMGTASAAASHKPSATERKAFRQAVQRSNQVPTFIREGHFELTHGRISDRGPWARAWIAPIQVEIDAALVLFRKRSRGWRLVTVGTSGVGCSGPKPGPAVRRELGLRCP